MPITQEINVHDVAVHYSAGSDEFLRWFQDRSGSEPQDPDSIALDYGMNMAFKALPAWYRGTRQNGELNYIEDFNDYRGVGSDD